jgi:hypothetical protein
VLRRDEFGALRRARGGDDVQPGRVAHRVGLHDLGLAHRGLVTDDVGEGLLGPQVEVTRDAAELQRHVEEDDAVGPADRRGHRDVRRDGRRPDAALRAVHGDDPASPAHRQPVGRDDRRHAASALEAQQERLDARLELAGVERAGHHVVRAGLQEADPLVDVIGLADAQDRDAGHGRGRAHLGA